MFARFTNKIPMRSVKALKVGERWQIRPSANEVRFSTVERENLHVHPNSC